MLTFSYKVNPLPDENDDPEINIIKDSMNDDDENFFDLDEIGKRYIKNQGWGWSSRQNVTFLKLCLKSILGHSESFLVKKFPGEKRGGPILCHFLPVFGF